MASPEGPSIAFCAEAACLLEVSARKAGNVHRGQDFSDLRFVDFVLSGIAIGPVLENAAGRGVGATILACIEATRRVTGTNTNLGIVLLLAPLAAVPRGESIASGLPKVLHDLTVADARLAYEAIRLAVPGGMGKVDAEDVHSAPTQTLAQVMALAAGRDLIARQYTNGFREVLEDGVPFLHSRWAMDGWEAAIQTTHLHFLAQHGDSLIARKCGEAESAEASRRARAVLQAGFPGEGSLALFRQFDDWLRALGNRRNPGTSADLVTAALFVAFRDGLIAHVA